MRSTEQGSAPETWRAVSLWWTAGLFVGVFGAGTLLAYALGLDPIAIDASRIFSPPSWAHPFGTDALGRDVFARALAGVRVSLVVACLGSFLTLAIGLPIGLYAGLHGGRADAFLMRLTDAVSALPKLPVVIVLASAARSDTLFGDLGGLLAVIVLLGWTTSARLARAGARALAEADFVRAARLFGADSFWIWRKHLWPHLRPTFLVAAAVEVGELVLYESALSFLGLGVRPPTPSWGRMLAESLPDLRDAPWTVVFPALALILTVSIAHRSAETLRAAVSPLDRDRSAS